MKALIGAIILSTGVLLAATTNIDLTKQVFGILPVANGGTGSATIPTWNQSTTGNAATATNLSTNGSGNQVWGMNAGGSAQGWQTVAAGGTTDPYFYQNTSHGNGASSTSTVTTGPITVQSGDLLVLNAEVGASGLTFNTPTSSPSLTWNLITNFNGGNKTWIQYWAVATSTTSMTFTSTMTTSSTFLSINVNEFVPPSGITWGLNNHGNVNTNLTLITSATSATTQRTLNVVCVGTDNGTHIMYPIQILGFPAKEIDGECSYNVTPVAITTAAGASGGPNAQLVYGWPSGTGSINYTGSLQSFSY